MKQALYIAILLGMLTSCTALKNVKKETTAVATTEKEITQRFDSVLSIKQNRAINDKIVFKVPKQVTHDKRFDSIINAKLDAVLQNINFQKESGSNSYDIKYHPQTESIVASVKVGATADKSQSTTKAVKETSKETNFIQSISKKTGIPTKWLIGLLVFLLRGQIFWLLKKMFPVLSQSKFIQFFK